jgi:cytochrome c oxidase subunit I
MHRRWFDGGVNWEISKHVVFGLPGMSASIQNGWNWDWNKVSSISAWMLGLSQLPFILNFFWSIFFGKKVGRNPWCATTLEWDAPSPPPHGNFDTDPHVYRGPYEYSVPGADKDYLMQSEPPGGAVKTHEHAPAH